MPIVGALNSETVTVTATAIGITTTPSDGITPSAAFITVAAAQIRFWMDGSTPTASEGNLADPGDTITLASRNEVLNFLAIRTGGTDAVLSVTPAAEYVS